MNTLTKTYSQPHQVVLPRLAVSTSPIPFPHCLRQGEKGIQAPAGVYCQTDNDRISGEITFWPEMRIVVCCNGRVYLGSDWSVPYRLYNEVAEADGRSWQVLIDRTGRDLWIEKAQYDGLVALATTIN